MLFGRWFKNLSETKESYLMIWMGRWVFGDGVLPVKAHQLDINDGVNHCTAGLRIFTGV